MSVHVHINNHWRSPVEAIEWLQAKSLGVHFKELLVSINLPHTQCHVCPMRPRYGETHMLTLCAPGPLPAFWEGPVYKART